MLVRWPSVPPVSGPLCKPLAAERHAPRVAIGAHLQSSPPTVCEKVTCSSCDAWKEFLRAAAILSADCVRRQAGLSINVSTITLYCYRRVHSLPPYSYTESDLRITNVSDGQKLTCPLSTQHNEKSTITGRHTKSPGRVRRRVPPGSPGNLTERNCRERDTGTGKA